MEEKDTKSYTEEIYENLTDLTANLMTLEQLCTNYASLCRKYGQDLTCYCIDRTKKFADDYTREISNLSQHMIHHTLT